MLNLSFSLVGCCRRYGMVLSPWNTLQNKVFSKSPCLLVIFLIINFSCTLYFALFSLLPWNHSISINLEMIFMWEKAFAAGVTWPNFPQNKPRYCKRLYITYRNARNGERISSQNGQVWGPCHQRVRLYDRRISMENISGEHRAVSQLSNNFYLKNLILLARVSRR